MKKLANLISTDARRKPLAACLAALFALAAPEVFASNLIVGSCADDGSSRTLRSVISGAADGDTIDMTALRCSYISLTTGAIAVVQNNLTIQGPGVTAFPVLNSQTKDTVLAHYGTGTLIVEDLYLKFGTGHRRYFGTVTPVAVLGGCLMSYGSVELVRSRVYACNAYSSTADMKNAGAGVYARKNLILVHSTISGNSVDASSTIQNPTLVGGGAFVGGNLIAKYSTIESNQAGSANSGTGASGGGAYVLGNASIYYSTIAHNSSKYQAGGLAAKGKNGTYPSLTIKDSTITNNSAPQASGIFSVVSTTIDNSTIASNDNTAGGSNANGIVFEPLFGSITVNLHSTLIANNNSIPLFGASKDDDLGVVPSGGNKVVFSTDSQQGNFNLIRVLDSSVSASSLPPDTQIGVCPLLGSLRNNGGETQIIGLYSGSPAIGAGANPANLSYDQRGTGYPRMSGAKTDIGAYEVQQTDVIFNAGFEGCP